MTDAKTNVNHATKASIVSVIKVGAYSLFKFGLFSIPSKPTISERIFISTDSTKNTRKGVSMGFPSPSNDLMYSYDKARYPTMSTMAPIKMKMLAPSIIQLVVYYVLVHIFVPT